MKCSMSCNRYGIVGIPEIMLLDPDGLILAKV